MTTQMVATNSNLNSSEAARDQGDQPSSASVKKPWVMNTLMNLGAGLFFFLSGFAIYVGWILKDKNYLTAENGTGYMLGIIGSAMMLILLLYPMRKRFRFMSGWGPLVSLPYDVGRGGSDLHFISFEFFTGVNE
jgi:hypothetical protein